MAENMKFGMKNIPSCSVFLASVGTLAGLLAGAPEAADRAILSAASLITSLGAKLPTHPTLPPKLPLKGGELVRGPHRPLFPQPSSLIMA